MPLDVATDRGLLFGADGLERDYGSQIQIVAISSNSTLTHPQET